MKLNHFMPLKGGRGILMRRLDRWAPSFRSSPLRRVIQGLALVAFLGALFWTCWPYGAEPDPQQTGWPAHFTDHLAAREYGQAELFLIIDPLVAISTALAAKAWVWSLTAAGIILAICLWIPRGFCGYLCPLGTLIDIFDSLVAGRIHRFRIPDEIHGRWMHVKYVLLVVCLVGALGGLMLGGFFAAIPILTRSLIHLFQPLQIGLLRGGHALPPFELHHLLSLLFFAGIFALSLFRPRFWCRYVCPSGAVFSLGNLLRLSQRKVSDACISCDRCRQVCPFDAIQTDYHTRTMDCTLCETCGGVCPTQAITFVGRRATLVERSADPQAVPPAISRRGLLTGAAAGALLAVGGRRLWGADVAQAPDGSLPLRPPGSVPEQDFLQLCIRCGECMQVCPENVLLPLAFEQGIEGLWTPVLRPESAGCEPSCNACGQVCPTGAIRALDLVEKRHARIGLAVVNETTCLPYAGSEPCRICVDACNGAGYEAIEFVVVHAEVDEVGAPVAETGLLAPVVKAEACVGCGQCENRCHSQLVTGSGVLGASAIRIVGGRDKEDRLHSGSYVALREAEAAEREQQRREQERAAEAALGDFY